jgi:putative flippase GtrA
VSTPRSVDLRRLARYAVSGAASALTHVAVLVALVAIPTVNYTLNARWTFTSAPDREEIQL